MQKTMNLKYKKHVKNLVVKPITLRANKELHQLGKIAAASLDVYIGDLYSEAMFLYLRENKLLEPTYNKTTE